jgi:hypothetical protein
VRYLIGGHLDERMRRLVAAAEAEAIGFGGASIVARATGVSRRAIRTSARELQEAPRDVGRVGEFGDQEEDGKGRSCKIRPCRGIWRR